MPSTDLARLALAGLISVGCGGKTAPVETAATNDAAQSTVEETATAADASAVKVMESPQTASDTDAQYVELHDCSGANICKGLGGCKVTQESLEKMAAKRGIDMSEAGSPHDCSGLNACKGLGGCHVDAEKLAKLKAKLEAPEEAAPEGE
jgi:hypothetical protein